MPAPVTKATRLASLYAHLAAVKLPLVEPARKPSAGDVNARLMIVFGHAFTDLAGHEAEYINAAFAALHMDKRLIFFSYAIRGTLMRKVGNDYLLDHRDARAEEIDAYRPFLLEEIAIIDPGCVLCVGSTAIKTLMGDTHFSVTKMAGAELHVDTVSCPVIATVSFSYVIRTGGKRSPHHKQFMADLERAKHLAVDPEIHD